MKVVSIANYKGGVGKTTTAINLGAGLRQQGKEVLLLDMDPQANLTHALGIDGDNHPGIYSVLHKEAFGEAGAYLKDSVVKTAGLQLVPSSLDLAGTELELASVYGREKLLSQLLKPLKGYDFILIDCPPSMGLLTVNALVASHWVLIPLQAEFLPMKGLQSFLKQFKMIQKLNPKLKLMGFLLTNFDGRKKMHQDIRQAIAVEFSGDMVFKTPIRTNIALANAQAIGKDIFRFDKNSHGAADYASFTLEFLSRT